MKAEFQGTPLVQVPAYNPKLGFLKADPFGKEALEEYNRIVSAEYGNNLNLKVLSESGDLIVGSNPLAVVCLNDRVLRPAGLRTATQADLELILKHRPDLQLRGVYEDTGLVLRSEGNPNSYLAKDLARQLKERDPHFGYPVLFYLSDLSLRVDQDSPHALAFTLKEGATPKYVSILNSPDGSRFNSSDIDKVTGLPRDLDKQGNRKLRTITGGLSRLRLSSFLNLISNWNGLADSDGVGRVVVCGLAAQKSS